MRLPFDRGLRPSIVALSDIDCMTNVWSAYNTTPDQPNISPTREREVQCKHPRSSATVNVDEMMMVNIEVRAASRRGGREHVSVTAILALPTSSPVWLYESATVQ